MTELGYAFLLLFSTMAGPNDLVAGGQSDCATPAAVGMLDNGGRTPCCWPRGHLFDVGRAP